MTRQAIEDNRRRYAVRQWGDELFDIDAAGRLVVRLQGDDGPDVVLTDIAGRARAAGLRLPLLVRFPDILRQRVSALQQAFATALADHDYSGAYTPVYPIKVNQQASVVRTLAGVDGVGLEVGSKPELIAALAMSRAGGTIICNGYKDAQYIRLALAGTRLGLDVCVVIEKPNEWQLIRREAEHMGVTPRVGVRLRLTSLGSGNWQNTGGERAKFGLGASQLLDLVRAMDDADCLGWLDLLHFHMGSQISNLRDIQRGVREAGRYLIELSALGVKVRTLDIGGGLGVDYEGARSRSFCSMNYSLQQYASAIVQGVGELCRAQGLPLPHLLSESGRALTAHHAVLITNVTAREASPEIDDGDDENSHPLIVNLCELLKAGGSREPEELFLDAESCLEEARNRFLYGDLKLESRARIEPLYYAVLRDVRARLAPHNRRHRELLDRIDYKLSDKYFVNLSIFQSLPDIWAIDQVFPICPLQDLDRPPTRRTVLEDLTCDSDGRIDRYVDHGVLEATLPVHELPDDRPYLLGFFLAGAYQETLGDMHNLFGDTDSVDVHLDDNGLRLDNARCGDSADTILRYVGYEASSLLAACRARVAAAGLDATERDNIERLLAEGLSSYTYLGVEG